MNYLLRSFRDGEILDRVGVLATLEPKFLIPETIDFWDCLGLLVDWLMVALNTIHQS